MRIIITSFFLFFLISGFNPLQAQTVNPVPYYPMNNWDTSPYKSYRFTRAEASWEWINFRLLFPNDYDSAAQDGKKYPIIIMLHGAGESGRNDWKSPVKKNHPYPLDDPRRDNNDHHLVFGGREHLRAVQSGRFPGFVLYPQNFYGTWVSGRGDASSSFHQDLAKAIDLTEYLVNTLKIDPARIYIHGLSNGGLGTWLAAYKRPDLFAAALPMSAPGDPAMAEQLEEVPLWVFQGELDTNPRPWATEQTIDAVREAGGEVRYTLYEGTGHNTWNKAYAEPDFFEWMLAQEKGNVTDTNEAPLVEAGENKNITLPANTASFTAVASDPDGTIASYSWTKTEGPEATLSGAGTATLSLSDLVQGTYTFQVRVTDNKNALASDEVTLVVNPASNVPPTLSAGDDKEITLPENTASFTATATDSDGTIASWLWEEVNGREVTMAGAETSTLSLSGLEQGTYNFKVTVTDNGGAKISDHVVLTVKPAPNVVPLVNAGDDREIALPESSLTFTAEASDPDGNIAAYRWEKISGPEATLAGATTPELFLSDLQEGSYVFRITVTDNEGATATDEAGLKVNPAPNKPPVVNAGTDKAITLPENTVGFTATASDPEGGALTYLWEKVSGPEATLAGAATAGLSLSDLAEGSYVFRITVKDNAGTTAVDEVGLVVNPAPNKLPVVDAGEDKMVTLPVNSASFTATASDPDGSIATYLWEKESGPAVTLSGEATQTLSISGLTEGSYSFSLTVTDNQGAAVTDQVVLHVNPAANQAPSVNAGTDKTLTLPENTTTFTATASDPDGTISTYLWEKVKGPDVTMENTGTQALSLSGLQEGAYTFRITVTDNAGSKASDEVGLVVNPVPNQPPVINAGTDKNITLPENTATFTATASDPEGKALSYLWEKISGPAATLSGVSTATLSVSGLTEGTYTFRVSVTDVAGATATDDVVLVVSPAPNQGPTVNAGNDKVTELPVNTVSFTATASDPDGSIASYLWETISGSPAILSGATTPELSVGGLTEGSYIFRISVTDNEGAVARDEVALQVKRAPNVAPTVNAGEDITIVLPENTASLTAVSSDPDGAISEYLWTKVSGPEVAFRGEATETLNLFSLTEGSYIFKITVTDNRGGTASDEVNVLVKPAANKTPVVEAGEKVNLTLPENAVTLTATASDPDGSIASYLWEKVNGPAATLAGTDRAALDVKDLEEGSYTFRLTVTDNKGATASDEVIVSVFAEAAGNQFPLANAGSDTTVVLPLDYLGLKGTGSDNDGEIVSYLWEKVSGPEVQLGYPDSSYMELAGLVTGEYVLRLTVTDDEGATDQDEMILTVTDTPVISGVDPAEAGFVSLVAYPNPFESFIKLKLEYSRHETLTVRVFDPLSKTIFRGSFEAFPGKEIIYSMEPVLGKSKQGIYFIEVRSQDGKFLKMIRVMKK